MKVYISADMEGTSGISHFSQVDPANPSFLRYIQIWQDDLNALIDGAIAGGADEVMVNEGHNGMNYFYPDRMHPKANYISGRLKSKNQMECIEDGYDIAFLMCHSMAGTNGVLSHSFVPGDIWEMKLNGKPIGEIGLNILMASNYNTPVGLIVSDDTGCAEAAGYIPEIRQVVTKEYITQLTTKNYCHEHVMASLKNQAEDAVRNAASFTIWREKAPYRFEVTFSVPAMVELISYIPGMQVTGPRSVAYECSDYLELTKIRILIVNLARMIGSQL